MNNDPQLIIFEPLKEPRTVTLNVIEDINAAPPVIFDENGQKVTNYKVLFDESQSAVDPVKEEIIAYIENWESQGNVIDEKQARKIAKRKRIQAAKKLRKQRNKKRKAAMKSLIHCNFDTSPLANTNVEEERAILRAMKTQKHSIKSILNIKPNRIINCNTNVRPFENSTIEFGSKKTPMDVVVLDSDEESGSDSDDIQINIDTPQPISTRQRRTANTSANNTFRNQNSSATIVPNTRKRRNRKVEIVQIVDSSDSDVECVTCEEFIQSLSDDDDDVNNASTSKKKRLNNLNFEDKFPTNSEELDCVPVDEEASNELMSLVDSFCDKYIESIPPVIVPLTEITSQTDSEFPAPQILISVPISLQPNPLPVSMQSEQSPGISSQIVITEPISLQTNPSFAPVESENSSKTSSQIVITEPVSLQTNPPPVPIESGKSSKTNSQILIMESVSLQPNFSSMPNESKKRNVSFVNDEELIIVENDPVNDLIQTDSHKSDADEEVESENSSDDTKEFEPVSEEDDERNTNVLEFDSIPSPDYAPSESILKTPSNMKAFADFMRDREVQDTAKDDKPEYDSPVEMEETASVLTTKIAQKSNTACQTSPKCVQPSPKKQCHPWQKRGTDESDEISVDEHPRMSPIQNIRPWQKSCNDKSVEIQVLEHAEKDSQSCKPWQKRNYDDSDEIQILERPTTVREQPSCFQKKSPVSIITRPEQAVKANFGREHSFPNQKLQETSVEKTVPSPKVTDAGGNQSQRSNRPSAFSRLDNTNFTPVRQSFCPNNRRPVFDRLGNFQSGASKLNSSVECFDKKINRIGESQNELEKVTQDKNYFEQERYVEPADHSHPRYYAKKFFNDGRNEPWNKPRQNQNNSQSRTFDNRFRQQREEQCSGTMSVYEEEPLWQYESATETKGDNSDEDIDMDNEIRGQGETKRTMEHRDGFPISVITSRHPIKYHAEPYEESKYVPKSNRYHPEPYEENKFTPGSTQPFNNRQVPWRNQNRGRFQNGNQFRLNNQHHNRRTEYNENNFNQGNRQRPRFSSNQEQRFDRNQSNRRFFRHSTPNTSRCGQQSGGSFQNSRGQQQSSYSHNNYHRNQPQTGSSSSLNACSTQFQANREILFTRRDKFDYKANVGDFDDHEVQRPQTRFYQQNDYRNYESDVVKKLRSVANNENSFSWENSRACDFVPFNANEPVGTSPPWSINDSDTDCNSRIKAISRRPWISDVINSRT